MSRKNLVALALLFSLSTADPAFAETAYQRWLRMAVAARSRGNYDGALSYYQRAADESPNGPNDPDINKAIFEVLSERLQSLQTTDPNYVRYIRIADEAYYNGEYDTAIQNYRMALRERPHDRYATRRIEQAECIKKNRPATGSQFRTMCPRF
jgi:tetratricopeptide (TPR) repeat protein